MCDFKVCRVCLQPSGKVVTSSIFDKSGEHLRKIQRIGGIIISRETPHGNALICSQCVSDLDFASKVREKIRKADLHLNKVKPEPAENPSDPLKIVVKVEKEDLQGNDDTTEDEASDTEDQKDTNSESQSSVTSNDDSYYHCELCSHKALTPVLLENHVKKCHNNKEKAVEIFHCKIDGPVDLKSHQRFSHPQKPVTNESEDSTSPTSSKPELNKLQVFHPTTSRGALSFKCKICSSKFLTKRHLDYHIQRHTKPNFKPRLRKNDETFQCDECGKYYTSKRHLDLHKNKVHIEIVCFCGKSFKKERDRARHHLICKISQMCQ